MTHTREVLATGRLNNPSAVVQVYFVAPDKIPGFATICPAGQVSTVFLTPIDPETDKEEITSEFEDLGWMATGTNTGLSGEVLAGTFKDPAATLTAAGFRVIDQAEHDKLVKEASDARAKASAARLAERAEADAKVAAERAEKRDSVIANLRKNAPKIADDLLFLLNAL